jgi:hypothetical protein
MTILSETVRSTVDIESRINHFLSAFDPPPSSRASSQPPTPRGGASNGGAATDRHDSSQDSSSQGAVGGVAYSPRQPRTGNLTSFSASYNNITYGPDHAVVTKWLSYKLPVG